VIVQSVLTSTKGQISAISSLEITKEEIRSAYKNVNKEFLTAARQAIKNITLRTQQADNPKGRIYRN